MSTKHSTPIRIGVFRRVTAAQQTIEALIRAGFPAEQISVICPEGVEIATPEDVNEQDPAGANTADAALGGGAVGAVLGGLAATGVVLSGGTGLLVVGPMLGAAGAGAVAGGFIGAMMTRGFEPEIADFYDQALGDGCVLVAVDPEAEGAPSADSAERIFETNGAEPIPLQRG